MMFCTKIKYSAYLLQFVGMQDFVQALLSTTVKFLKIKFLYCLLSLVAPWGGPTEFRFPDCLKIYFSWNLLGILKFYGEF